METQIAIYQDTDIELEIHLDQQEETIWLTQEQIAQLFQVEQNTIVYHIQNIYKDDELDSIATHRKIRLVRKEGGRDVSRDISHYNLDMILSVGYRVNSRRATRFRQWATRILKSYITQGYAINMDRFHELPQRLDELEKKLKDHDQQLTVIVETIRQMVAPSETEHKRVGFRTEER
jgi:hypothetical protein